MSLLSHAAAQPAAPPTDEPSSTMDEVAGPAQPIALMQWTVRPTIVFAGDQARPRSITSIGACSLIIDADRARVTVVATGTDASPAGAVELARAAAETIRTTIAALGLGDLEVHTNPVRTVTGTDDRNPTYTATVPLAFVTSSIDRMGEVTDAVRTLGFGTVAEFVRYVSDDRRRAAEGDCLAIAGGNARARAERLAATLGATLGAVLTIVDDTLPTPHPGLRTSKPAGDEPLPLTATLDQLIVSLSIVVEFALE